MRCEHGFGGVRWLLADHQGSVRDVADSAGTVLNHIIYGFGNVFSQSSSTVGLRFGYTGRELDAESGLWHYQRRYYDATVRRFLPLIGSCRHGVNSPA